MNIGSGLSGIGGTVSHSAPASPAPSAPGHPSVGSGVSNVARSVPKPFFNAPIRHTGSVGSALRSTGRAVQRSAPPGRAPGRIVGANVFQNPLQNSLVGLRMVGLQNIARALSQLPDNARWNQSLGRYNEVAQSAYLNYLSGLWNRTRGFYPPGAREPQTQVDQQTQLDLGGRLFTPMPSVQGAAAWVNRGASGPASGQAPMNVTKQTMAGTFSQDPYVRNYDQQVPIHEWAHIFQAPNVFRQGRPAIEGGAEAFKQQVAARLGMPHTQAPGYQGFVNSVRQRGAPYVMAGQFASPPYR